MRSFLFYLLLIFSTVSVTGQVNNNLETLSDSARIVTLNTLASKYITLEPDSGIYFGEIALKIGYRTKHFENLNETHRILGWSYYNQQNFIKTKLHLQYALNDTLLSTYERVKINEALVASSEKTGDYVRAYLFAKNLSVLKDSLHQQKQNASLAQLKSQLTEEQQNHTDELKRKEKIWQMNKTRQQQLLLFEAIIIGVLIILTILLFILLSRQKKHFNTVLEEKTIVITETNEQNRKLQDQLLNYEKLKTNSEKDERETRIQKIAASEKQKDKEPETKEQISIIDQFKNSSDDDKKKLLPRLESFANIIPTQMQIIEQAFARHDWEMINNTLQTMKSIIHAAGMYHIETLINEINEHVNANATNRAVVKLLHVKTGCTKMVVEVKKILEHT